MHTDKITWLADQIFAAYSQGVSGLKFYALGCGCIYYQSVFREGELDHQVGICRDAGDGPCQTCMRFPEGWLSRVNSETVIYNSRFQVDLRK